MNDLIKNLRLLCWIWIVAATLALVYRAPVGVTYRHRVSGTKIDDTVTRIEWIGPFGSPSRSDFVGTYGSTKLVKSSLDLSRLIAVLLAANLIPALMLWQHDAITQWWHRQQQHRPPPLPK